LKTFQRNEHSQKASENNQSNPALLPNPVPSGLLPGKPFMRSVLRGASSEVVFWGKALPLVLTESVDLGVFCPGD
jgi:hypothetical protein